MIIKRHWGRMAALAVAFHIPAVGFMGLLLPEEPPEGPGELAWIDIDQGEGVAGSAAPEQEKTEEPEASPVFAEESIAEELPVALAEEPQEKAKGKDGREETEDPGIKKPGKPRNYPPIRKPNKPAVLDEKTKHGLGAKETTYRGVVRFFVDISEEGRVVRLQAWRFEPEIADEKERRALEERLEKKIKETWQYKPSLTPEGQPTTQTKPEELELPEKEEKK